MADSFDIQAKLEITGVKVKGPLDAGKLKFDVDTSALKKLVSDAGEAAKRVKAKLDNIKLNKIRIELNQNSLRSVESKIRNAVQNAVKKTRLDIQTKVAGGTKTDPFKAQRQAAGKSAQSLQVLHDLTKQVNSGLRSLVRTMGSMKQGPATPGAAKGNLPFPPGARTVSVGSLGGGGGRIPPQARGGAGAGGFDGSDGIRRTAGAIKEVTNNTKDANKQMVDLEELTFQVGRKAAAFRGVAIAINTMVNAAQAAVSFVIQFNDSLIELNKILQVSDKTLAIVGDDLFALSSKTGVAVDQTIQIAQEFARAGLAGRGYGTVVELTDRALLGLQGTTLDATQASELFIQIIQQVEANVRGLSKELITTSKLFDVLGKAEDITASKATDVQQAFKRSAASIFATGATIEQATAIISVLQERTQRGGDVVGTALKTLASRISSSTSDATKALNAIGVATIDAQGNLRNLFDVLQDTAVAFQSLTEAERADVAVKAAGIRQVEIFRAALLDFSRTQDVTNQLVEASGDAARKQAAEQKKLANIISRLQIGLQELVKTASENIIGESFVFVVEMVQRAVTAVAAFDKALNGAISTFAALVVTGLGLKVLHPMIIGISRAFSFFVNLQKESTVAMAGVKKEGMAVATTVEGQINASMQKTAALTNQANTAMGTFTATTAGAAMQAERLAGAMQRSGGLGGGFAGPAAPGNRDVTGGAIIAAGTAGQSFKQVGKLDKAVKGAGKAFDFVSKNILGFGVIASIAGASLQSFSTDLKNAGKTTLGGAADIGGGGLGGFGAGALIGSFIAPGVGTAIGGGIGAIVGALPALIRTFGNAKTEIESLRDRYIKLGIVQAENGEITSAVASKLDKALRTLEGFQDFELRLEETALQNLFDPEGASKRRREVEQARESAQKGLEAGFDRTASVTERQSRILQALTKALQARTGDRRLDLADPQLMDRSAPALAAVSEITLQEIEKEALKLAEKFDIPQDQINRIFEEEIQKIKAKPLTKEVVEAAEQAVKKRTQSFIDSLDVLVPAGQQISDAAIEQSNKFKEAVSQIALGQGGEEARKIVRETLAKVLSGQTLLKGAEGETLVGRGGRNALQAQIDLAESIATQRRNVGVEGLGSALPNILKRFATVLDPKVAARQTERTQQGLIKSQERIVDAFSNIRNQFPLETFGRFLDTPINDLEVILRDFIAEFGREINKLNEAQIRAITPQQELSQALADNAAAVAKATQRRVELEKADAQQQARQAFQGLPNLGERQFAGVPGQEDNLRTVGDALKELFQALLDANRRIADERIIDPDRQRNILTAARGSVDLTNVDDKQIQSVSDSVLELTKTFVKLDTEALQAISKSNQAAVEALKKRLSEEQRLLTVDRQRREAAAMNTRALNEELTGIRRLVAERQLEAQLAEGNIGAQQGRIAGIDEEIAKLESIQQTEMNRAGILDQLEVLEKARTEESIKLEEMLAKQRIAAIRDTLSVAAEAVNTTKIASDRERKRISTLSDINNLLSVNQSQMDKFNAELDTLGAQFKIAQAELASEAAAVNATITDQAEKEARLDDIKKRGAALALEQAKAEAQIIQKRREAIKQVAEELLGNQQEQVDAQRAVIEATRGVSDAFEGYLQAVDGAIMATTRYNLGLALAQVETTRLTGGFSGLREQIGVVQDAFRDAERLAGELGASEKTLVEIRRESINQQLSLFNSLLQEQSQLARNFFTSATQDQADLFMGVREAGNVASLLGGSFTEFKKLGEGAINDLGAQLLALPQETRQRIVSSLETLRAVGGEVGGFTADQLLTAIETAALGVSGEGLEVDPLFEIQERIATLQEEQARLATEQLIASQEQVTNAKQQLEQAEAAKDLAEIQLERIQEEGERLRGKLGDLQGQLNTTLLQQEQTQRQGFNSVTSAVARAANAIVTQLPDAFSARIAEVFRDIMGRGGLDVPTAGVTASDSRPTPESRGRRAAEAQRVAGRNRAIVEQQFAQSGPSTINQAVAVSNAPAGGGTDDLNQFNANTVRRLEDIVTELRELNSTAESNLTVSQEIRDGSGNTLGVASANVAGAGGQTEITINVEGTTTVSVTGFEAGVARLATTLAESLGGFVSTDEARRIANEVLENIRTELLRRGIITPTTL